VHARMYDALAPASADSVSDCFDDGDDGEVAVMTAALVDRTTT